MSSRLRPTHLLDVVIAESPAILKLLSGKDKTLLVRGNALLVLDLALHIVDGVTGLDLEGNGLARQSLDEAVRIFALVACSWCCGFEDFQRGIRYVHLHCDIISI